MKVRECGVQEEFLNVCKILYERVEANVLLVENVLDGLKRRQG